MKQYLRYVAAVVAVAATATTALVAFTNGAEARSRHRHHYSAHHHYKHYAHRRVHHARRNAVRRRLVIDVRQPTAQAAAVPEAPYSESAIHFASSPGNRVQVASLEPTSTRSYTLKGDGTFGDLVQGTYGGTRDLVHAAERYLYTNPTGRSRAWCRAFVNLVARKQGYRINPSLMARAPTGGVRVSRPVPGAVAKSRSHTGFVKTVSADGRKILLISGNSGGRGPGRRTTTESWRSASMFSYEVLRR